QERFRVPARRLVLVPNGIDVSLYADNDSESSSAYRTRLLAGRGGPLVVAVGNLSSVKGHEHLVEAAARVAGELSGLRVVILGREGDNAAVVRHRIASLGLEDHVLLAGETADVPRALAAADLFVHPSSREGL